MFIIWRINPKADCGSDLICVTDFETKARVFVDYLSDKYDYRFEYEHVDGFYGLISLEEYYEREWE